MHDDHARPRRLARDLSLRCGQVTGDGAFNLYVHGDRVATSTVAEWRSWERSSHQAKLLGIDALGNVETTVTEITQEGIARGEQVRKAQTAAAVAAQR